MCVSVNDPFVMAAWGEQQHAEGKVRMLADTKVLRLPITSGALASCNLVSHALQADLTKALGFEFDATQNLGNVRCRRFSMIVQDNEIKVFTGYTRHLIARPST